MTAPARITASDARRLLLGAQALLDPPTQSATPASVSALVERLGFVQLDSINVVARAHDLTLASRLDGYRPEHLSVLLEEERSLFEHWTHDASAIPSRWFAHWKPRFRRDAARLRANAWWRERIGADEGPTLEAVRARIAAEGPLLSSDFEHPGQRGPWWGWKPQKAALDFLWRTGELAVRGRVRFQKVYDLTARVLPRPHAAAEPTPAAHLDWACSTAAERLGVFTPRELAGFWDAVEADEAGHWCARAVREGRLVPVLVEGADGSKPQPALAPADVEARLAALPEPATRTCLLSPFDPVLRDRARARRRFGFDYRFEAFTPAGRRQYGYYCLPILEGDRLVGRLDPKVHRERGVLEVRGLWWEPGVEADAARLDRLAEAVERLAHLAGAARVVWPRRVARQRRVAAAAS